MRDDDFRLLSLPRLPGRLDSEQAAAVLGFRPHDLPVLIKAKLLRTLGNPTQQAVKFYCSAEVEKAAKDANWLNRASRTVYSFWENQNRQRRARSRHRFRNSGITLNQQLGAAAFPVGACLFAKQKNQ
jgi:hypothetical protein